MAIKKHTYKKRGAVGTQKRKQKRASILDNKNSNSNYFKEFEFKSNDKDGLNDLNEFKLNNLNEFDCFSDFKEFEFKPKDFEEVEFSSEAFKEFDFNLEDLKRQNLLEDLKNELKRFNDCMIDLFEFASLNGSNKLKKRNKKVNRIKKVDSSEVNND